MALTKISTAGLEDQSVTLDKLPHGTGSTDGKFLRANNGADPTFETVSTTPADGSITQAKLNFPVANKNILINGDMRVCQRPTSTTSINAYIVDRWRSFGGPLGVTFSQVSDATNYPQSQKALRVHRTAGNSQTNNIGVGQGVETINSKPCAGKTVVLSFKARRGANFSGSSNLLEVGINGGEGTNQNPFGMTNTNGASSTFTLTESVQTFNLTYAVPTDKTQLTVLFKYTPSGTAGANDWFEITECQLEIGSTPTDFEFLSYGDQLNRCFRYYFKETSTTAYMFGYGSSPESYGLTQIPQPTAFRTTPTITITGSQNVSSVGSSAQSPYYSMAYGNTTSSSAPRLNGYEMSAEL